jgi:hypothetical protein
MQKNAVRLQGVWNREPIYSQALPGVMRHDFVWRLIFSGTKPTIDFGGSVKDLPGSTVELPILILYPSTMQN